MARNRVIGKEGALPWHLPAELQHFKAVTMGKPVVMGRKTFESIGRPLPGRANIVVTRRTDFEAAGVTIKHDWRSAVAVALETALGSGKDEIMVIGGGEIYVQALPRASRIYLTEVQADIAGDTIFPELERAEWQEASRVSHAAEGDRPAYDIVLLERMSA